MNKGWLIVLLLSVSLCAKSQISSLDSMKMALLDADNDSLRYGLLVKIGYYYADIKTDSALYFLNLGQSVAITNNKKLSAAYALSGIGYCLIKLNAYSQSLEAFNEGFGYAEDPKNRFAAWDILPRIGYTGMQEYILTGLHMNMGHLLGATNNREQQLSHYRQATILADKNSNFEDLSLLQSSIGHIFYEKDDLDSALIMQKLAVKMATETNYTRYLARFYNDIARIYLHKGKYDSARTVLYNSAQIAFESDNTNDLLESFQILSTTFLSQGNKDSSLYYARLSLDEIDSESKDQYLGMIYENLFKAYALNGRVDSAYKYQGLALTTKDSLYNEKIKVFSEFQNLSLGEKLRIKELEKDKIVSQERLRTYTLLGGIALIFLLGFIFYRSSRLKQKAHERLKKAYSELKETQKQLVQSEKMASLGELTAGIAHEIQNPLNFVKNFSEVNSELTEELLASIQKGDLEDVKLIAADLTANQEKIREHGKRAESIVKSMLQHSRTSTGQKEKTDINALCEEYCRLAYHGMRAKDKNLHAEVKTHLSNILVPVEVIPQEIGRVVLNLVNNAVYAVDKKFQKGIAGYKPEVLLTTSRNGNNIEIKIKDNGDGISEKVRDKIFQPFFTTKPTGEGTGLGLSISYDIITKGHGGSLSLDSREGIGTTATIVLPIKS
jgi:signal transduction histidine kinase